MNSGDQSLSPAERQKALVQHLARYRISIREVLLRRIYHGAEVQLANALQALRRKNLVSFRTRGLAGGHTFYQLTEAAYLELGVGEHAAKERAKPPSAQPLHKALATLWFCTMYQPRRRLLDEKKAFDLIPLLPPGNDPHVLEELLDGTPRLYRLYIPGSRAGHAYTLKNLKSDTLALARTPAGEALLRSGTVAFAILVHSEARRDLFERELERIRPLLPLGMLIPIALSPSPDTLPHFLADRPAI